MGREWVQKIFNYITYSTSTKKTHLIMELWIILVFLLPPSRPPTADKQRLKVSNTRGIFCNSLLLDKLKLIHARVIMAENTREVLGFMTILAELSESAQKNPIHHYIANPSYRIWRAITSFSLLFCLHKSLMVIKIQHFHSDVKKGWGKQCGITKPLVEFENLSSI